MSILQAVILGLIQGIGEFLPISSSGHLMLIEKIFGLEMPLIFDVFLHIATLLAVLIVFWKKIWHLLCVLGRWICRRQKAEGKKSLEMILALIVATAITAVLGLVVSKILPELPIQAVYIGWLITAFLLFFSSRLNAKKIKNAASTGPGGESQTSTAEGKVSVWQGIITGIAQGIGCLPGISRSGITISASLFSGVERNTAGEFSFLLSIPAIVGAFILEAKDGIVLPPEISLWSVAASCLTAFLSGLAALMFLMKLIRKGKLEYFSYYLILLAAVCFIFVR